MLDYTTVMLASVSRRNGKKRKEEQSLICVVETSFFDKSMQFMICLHIAVVTTENRYFADGTTGSWMDVS